MKKYECSMAKKKESLSRIHESSIGEVADYSIMDAYKISPYADGDVLDKVNAPKNSYTSASDLYRALDKITGGETMGKLRVVDTNRESDMECYLDVEYAGKDDKWRFRIWVSLEPTDPVATALGELQLK